MGIDDIEGALLLKEMGAKRIVLSREVSIEKIKEIKSRNKKNTKRNKIPNTITRTSWN